jgi:asparagine synthase (glutamine-hydrolysing)
MCGVTGLWMPAGGLDVEGTVGAMADTLVHRGPDDAGTWLEPSTGLALGHRRLSILDLSPEGHQPKVSESGRFVIAFNGEIYNFRQLREQLSGLGHQFRGHSDTEVLLAALEEWDIHGTLPRLNGMFAFATWDSARYTLHLARDRLGEKPMFWCLDGGRLALASELRALRRVPWFSGRIDHGALRLFVRHNYVPAPHTIFEGVEKLLPGTVVSFRANDGAVRLHERREYWSLRRAYEAGAAEPYRGNPEDVVDELERLLGDAVALRMVADVPLGAFLSGGIDSSTIVAIMQRNADQPIRTFSIGVHDPRMDEAVHAARIAAHLGTRHTELYVDAVEALEVARRLPTMFDEPFADSSQIPTFLVSRLARRDVTVALSGDGGDELFGGYSRYEYARALWGRLGRVPQPLRGLVGRGLKRLPTALLKEPLELLNRALPARWRTQAPADKVRTLGEMLAEPGFRGFYRRLVSHIGDPGSLVPGGREPASPLADADLPNGCSAALTIMQFLDSISYLPDDILTKVDRTTMAVSLEGRIPLLDHRIVEFAASLPPSLLLRDGRGKWPLRQVLQRSVPVELFDRPKSGFGIPIDAWLKADLREWAEDLLSEPALRSSGLFDVAAVRSLWDDNLSGRRPAHYLLWNIIVFQAWHDDLARHG